MFPAGENIFWKFKMFPPAGGTATGWGVFALVKPEKGGDLVEWFESTL